MSIPRTRQDAQRRRAIEIPADPEPENGRQCPNCGEAYVRPSVGWVNPDQVPHENVFDCIRYLRTRLEEAERILERHNL